MRVLVACEESQAVTIHLRRLGHEAYSADLKPASGGRPEWHILGDVAPLLHEPWDMVIAFPPCTHLAVSGARWWPEKRADGRQQAAERFFMECVSANAPRVAVENPVGRMSTVYRGPDQVIHPWQFGHGETKATCLWLRGLPTLESTELSWEREQRIWRMPPSPERSAMRSKTYDGIARAMADQWTRPQKQVAMFS